MAPKGNKPRQRAAQTSRKTANHASDIYQDMLAEAVATETSADDSERPLKRRKAAAPRRAQDASGSAKSRNDGPSHSSATEHDAPRRLQTIEMTSESDDDEDESDFAFEDVDLDHPAQNSPDVDDEGDIRDINITVDPANTPKRSQHPRRKPTTLAERAIRLTTHKIHVLCLLAHGTYVNKWCNDAVVQQKLRNILSKKTRSYLKPKSGDSQFQQNRSFLDGLKQASDAFAGTFEIKASGMRKANWTTDSDEQASTGECELLDLSELITAATTRTGSQDVGNQLFCALLRSVGVEARLVYSLQPLPFGNSPSKSSTPQRNMKPTIYIRTPASHGATSVTDTGDLTVTGSRTIGKVPSARRRLGETGFVAPPERKTPTPRKMPIRKLSYPIFWVEAFNKVYQKWIPVDPLVTQTVNKPSKLEPPSSYDLNQMSYVIAYESHGFARDVTRRYAKAYNAKTRRQRVEMTENGEVWLKKAMRVFRRRRSVLDRDQVEDAELAQKEAREGLPNNVQDFKDHPYYALERHLKRHEVLHPRREVGKVNAGTAAKPKLEPVYRRQDVSVCRSSDKWYRLGREIQKGEQPIKHVPARSRKLRSPSMDEGDAEKASLVALYAPFQTEMYIPPPVVKGKVPRNAYGNLDVYVPSMIPAGGTQIRHQLAAQAAKVLKIDYAEAVSGFSFKGRHGTAVIDGVVIAAEYEAAIWEVIEGLELQEAEEESRARSAVALRTWKRFLTGLRIQERVSAYGDQEMKDAIAREEDEQEEFAEAGGFIPEIEEHDMALPTAGRFRLQELNQPARKSRPAKRRTGSETEEEAESSDASSGRDTGPRHPFTRTLRNRRMVQYDPSEPDDDSPVATLGLPTLDSPSTEAGGFMLEKGNDGSVDGGGFVPDGDDEIIRGGGFVPDGDDEMLEGGGFVPEGDENMSQGGGLEPEEDEDHHGEPESGGSMFEDGLKDTSQHALCEQCEDLPGSDSAQDETLGEKHNLGGPTELLGDALPPTGLPDVPSARANESHATNAAMTEGARPFTRPQSAGRACGPGGTAEVTALPKSADTGKAEEQSDVGSMLSHDPEDEDAEPDWLCD